MVGGFGNEGFRCAGHREVKLDAPHGVIKPGQRFGRVVGGGDDLRAFGNEHPDGR